MSEIRVLHIIARMNRGGTAYYVGKLVDTIPNSALATGFVQGLEIEDSIIDELKVYRIPHLGRKISVYLDFKAFLELRGVVKEVNPQIIHTHTFKAGLIGRTLGTNAKRVHTFHGHLLNDSSFSKLEKRLIVLAERALARRTDRLISVGELVGEQLRKERIGLNKSWKSIPPGVDVPDPISKAEARIRLKLDPNEFVVGWMARMAPVKKPLMFLELAEQLPNTLFAMAGGGELLELVRKKAPPNVKILGWVNKSEFWSAVDCGVSTSENEGMPISLIEAALLGIPLIATDVGSNSEVVSNGLTGFVVNGEIGELKEALSRLLENPNLVNSMSENAKQIAAKKFNSNLMIEEHLTLYKDLE
jgi:glycosyltransferase involved in cell wall biosynthesis